MPGILYVVATPIGNLEDVTLRALRVLREVSIIAAEDTRRTARLLQHYSIRTPTTSLHEHNEQARTPMLLDRLQRGESVALVSDAGTPVLSDPGALLIAAAHQAGVKVEPVPGPSAIIAALSAAGINSDGFLFAGFPPSRSNARKQWLYRLSAETRAIVLFEAPHRIRALLTDLSEIFGTRLVTLSRELTKVHEELVTRPIHEFSKALPVPKGEFTLIIHPPGQEHQTPVQVPKVSDLCGEFGYLTNDKAFSRREAIQSLSAKYQLPSRDVYRLLEEGKK